MKIRRTFGFTEIVSVENGSQGGEYAHKELDHKSEKHCVSGACED